MKKISAFTKALVIGVILGVVIGLVAGYIVRPKGIDVTALEEQISDLEDQVGTLQAQIEEKDATISSLEPKIAELEKLRSQFRRYEIGNKIVYFHQRMIDDAIVEGDYIRYQFDKSTKELLDKSIHWRDDLPEHLPPVISEEQAESLVKGEVQFSELYFISPDSDVFPIKPTPKNPCWVIRSIENGNIAITIIDAVEGKILGHGIPPPS